MQRRAAAAYFVLFVLIGAGAFGFMQVGMSQPQVELGGDSLAQGDTFTVDDRTYTVDTVGTEEGEGGTNFVGEISWFNDSARGSATVENDSEIALQDSEYQLVIPNGTDVSTFTLTEIRNVTALLANDPAVEDTLAVQNDREFVVFRENGSLQPLDEYAPPETREIGVGDELAYVSDDDGNVTATVDTVTPAEVALSWPAPANQTISLSEGTNLSLGPGGESYFVHFVDDSAVKILPNEEYYSSYSTQLADIDYYEERQNGMWGIIILSVLASILLLAAAYLPVKG
jgi:sorbitol-specific phosphotransferase system component IIA